MEITSASPEWDLSEDREIWRQFLATRTGTRLLPKLLESLPPLLEKGHVNAILIRNGVVKGWQEAVSALLALSVPEPEPVVETKTSAYPRLDDDAQWQDGQKISPTNP